MAASRILLLAMVLTPLLTAQTEPPNAVATALAFAHQFGSPDSLTPANDRDLKVKLIAALGTSRELTLSAAGDLFDKTAFERYSNGRDAISVDAMAKLLAEKTPQSRKDLHAKTRLHADLLSTQYDLIGEGHREPAQRLVEWIVKHYQPGQPVGVIIICTGNTRRSILGAAMGNLAAAFYGMEIRFASGGTEPVAFNPRTIASLKEIGFEIDATGKDAAHGSADLANPVYRMTWGKGQEKLEFSKKYTDAINPQKNFAAILVCSEADASCPKVTGASVRIPLPYLDPKAFDGAPFEAAKYAERRDDVGRFMLSVLMQSRRRLEMDGKLQ